MAEGATIHKLRNFTSAILQRFDLANKAGLTFEGLRDTEKALGYKKSPTYFDYKHRYRRDGIAARIVDAPAQATWRRMPVIKDDEDPDTETAFEKAWRLMTLRLRMSQRFVRVDKLIGLSNYAVLFIGVKGGRELKRPLIRVNGPEDVTFLSSFAEERVDIKKWDANPSSSRFGLPDLYSLSFEKTSEEFQASLPDNLRSGNTVDVHHSRIIHVAENLLEDDVFGRPRLERVWNSLDDLIKICGGTAEAVWRLVDKGFQIEVDPEVSFDDDDEAALQTEIENFLHGFQRYLRTRGVTVNSLGSDTPDPRGAFEAIVSIIAGASGIPQRILLGSERGELASTQDRASWNERINERRESWAEPTILRPLIDKFIEIGALPKPIDDEYEVLWPDLLALTDTEKADVAQKVGQAVARFAAQTSPQTPVVGAKEFRVKYLGLPAEVPDDDIPFTVEEERRERAAEIAKQISEGESGDSEDSEEEDSSESGGPGGENADGDI